MPESPRRVFLWLFFFVLVLVGSPVGMCGFLQITDGQATARWIAQFVIGAACFVTGTIGGFIMAVKEKF